MSFGNASGLNVPTSSLGDAETQHEARRGLAIYLGVVVVLTALFDVLVITFSPLWIQGRMFAPAVASVVARLVLSSVQFMNAPPVGTRGARIASGSG